MTSGSALAADSGELDARYERGNAKRSRGDWQGAIAEFDRVIAADPNRAEAYLARGWAKFCGGEVGAEHDARAYSKLKGYRERTSSYMVLLGYLSAKRAGKEEDAQAFLDQAKGEIRGDAWPQPVLRLFRREISPKSLLNAAKNETQETEAHAFLALDMLNIGNRKGAIEHLIWVRDHGVSRSIATDVARATLERIDPGQAIARRSEDAKRAGRSRSLRLSSGSITRMRSRRMSSADVQAGRVRRRTSTIASPLEILAGPLQVSRLTVQLTQSCIEQVIVLQRWVVREIPDLADGGLRSLHASEDDRPIEPVNR